MGRRGPESFMKRQREIKRRQKAMEKMARRHGRRKRREESAGIENPVESAGPPFPSEQDETGNA